MSLLHEQECFANVIVVCRIILFDTIGFGCIMLRPFLNSRSLAGAIVYVCM